MRYAVLDTTGLIVNTVEWDGKTEWSPPKGCTAVECPPHAGIGWKRSGKSKWAQPVADEAGFDRAFIEGE